MSFSVRFLGLTLLLFLSLNASAQSFPIDSIAFEIGEDKRMYTYCKVNDSDSLLYLIDTGASDMVVNANSEKKFSIKYDQEISNKGVTGSHIVRLSYLNTVHWGRQTVDSLLFIEIPYQNAKFDGIIGLQLMRQFVVEINYDKGKIFLFDKDDYESFGENVLKIEFIEEVPMIHGRLKINEEWFEVILEVDLGSTRSLDLNTPFVKNNLLFKKMSSNSVSRVTGSSGATAYVVNVEFDSLQIGNLGYENVKGGLNQIEEGMDGSSEFDGALGCAFLWNHRMIFDFSKNSFYIEN